MPVEPITTATFHASVRLRRKPAGMAAALLPYAEHGRVAVDAYQELLRSIQRAGLVPAVNMDTGYANYLSDAEQSQVLRWAVEALGAGARFVAGAYIEGRSGEVVGLYRRKIDEIVACGGTPILFQTARLHAADAASKVAAYRAVCRGYPAVIGFELGQVFAPNGEIWTDDVFRGMLDIPELIGAKHSSLDKPTELRRLRLRDVHRPDFKVYTGNDWGIDMIEYGSDYLLGLATFCPELFARRDALWQAGDPAYYALADALQHLGNVAFRAPVPAYKHSAATFLHLTGRLPTALPHPKCPRRSAWEADLMRECAQRLGLL